MLASPKIPITGPNMPITNIPPFGSLAKLASMPSEFTKQSVSVPITPTVTFSSSRSLTSTKPSLSPVKQSIPTSILTYDPNQITDIDIPIIPYKSSAELPTIKNPPPMSELPILEYRPDPITTKLNRYLITKDDNSDQDVDFGIEQQWLIFQRQGDEYDRYPEWNKYPESAYRESNNEIGYSILNEGMVRGLLPKIKPVPSSYNPEYERLLEYQTTQEDELRN